MSVPGDRTEPAGRAALRHARLTELVVAALELPESERVAFVRETCANDADLGTEALRLLARQDDTDLALDLAPTSLTAGRVEGASAAPSFEITGYRVLRVLGEGGMGTVYEAEQDRPRRHVALKLLRGWAVSRDELARFDREAHVLGRLQHPGICQVYEVGRTAAGMPFIAMELIDGVPLIRHANDAGLDRAQRLALACRICEAVAHAHERGIVHRDLKPDNILVNRDGHPKVLDFGIARATEVTAAMSLMTNTGAIFGTLAYMAPEQAAGQRDVDHRSDIYSLGVILFELLTGERPARLEGLPLPQALHVIQQADLSIASGSHPSLRGDLGTILGKALERDPARRYDSASALAADIRRHLSHEPIVARPPSLAYRVTKFTQRHRTMVVAAALVFAALSVGAALALRQAARANEQRQVAIERAEAAERESYRAHLAAASAAVDRGEWTVAAEHLARAPAAQRGWEADALEAVVHEQFGRLLLDEPTQGIAFSEDGREVLTTRVAGDRRELVRLSLPEGRVIATYPLDARPLVVPREARTMALAIALETSRATAPFDLVAAEDDDSIVTVRPCPVMPAPEGPFVEAMTRDGRLAALRTADGDTAVCDLATGVVARHRLRVGVDTALFPDGRRAAVAVNTDTEVTDLLTGESLWRSPQGRDASTSVAISPDGRALYTAGLSIEPLLRKWDSSTGRLLAQREVERGGGDSWAFSRDGALVAWQSDSMAIHILDADLSERTRRALPARSAAWLGFAADGRRLMAATEHSGLREWDLEAPAARARVAAHSSYVYDIAFAPDGARIASVSWDDTAKIWDARTRDVASAVTCTFARDALSLAWTRDGKAVIVHAGWSLHRVDAASGAVLARRILPVDDAFPEGDLDANASDDVVVFGTPRATYVLDASSLATLRELEPSLAVAWSPDGARLADISMNGRARVRDAQAFQTRWSCAEATEPGILQGLAWSRDGARLAVLVGGQVRVLDANDGKELAVITDPKRAYAVTWSPDRRRLVIGQWDGALGVWDPASGEQVLHLEAHGAYVKALAFSPDGHVLATAGGDGDVQVWDAR